MKSNYHTTTTAPICNNPWGNPHGKEKKKDLFYLLLNTTHSERGFFWFYGMNILHRIWMTASICMKKVTHFRQLLLNNNWDKKNSPLLRKTFQKEVSSGCMGYIEYKNNQNECLNICIWRMPHILCEWVIIVYNAKWNFFSATVPGHIKVPKMADDF